MDEKLLLKLKNLGCVVLKRSVVYKGMIINDFYLNSEDFFIKYLKREIFQGVRNKKERVTLYHLLNDLIDSIEITA